MAANADAACVSLARYLVSRCAAMARAVPHSKTRCSGTGCWKRRRSSRVNAPTTYESTPASISGMSRSMTHLTPMVRSMISVIVRPISQPEMSTSPRSALPRLELLLSWSSPRVLLPPLMLLPPARLVLLLQQAMALLLLLTPPLLLLQPPILQLLPLLLCCLVVASNSPTSGGQLAEGSS